MKEWFELESYLKANIKNYYDENLRNELENIINKVNSDIANQLKFSHRFKTVLLILRNKGYYININADKEEQARLKELLEKITVVSNMAAYQESYDNKRPGQEEEEQTYVRRLPNETKDEIYKKLYEPVNPKKRF